MNTALKPGKFILKQNVSATKELPVALFDASHGQPNWAQTGFTSRELHTNVAGLTDILCRLGFQCRTTQGERLSDLLPQSRLLVLHWKPNRQRISVRPAKLVCSSREVKPVCAQLG